MQPDDADAPRRPDRPRSEFPIDPASQRWGLGDVSAGILASVFLTATVGGLIIAAAGWSDGSGDVEVPIWGQALLQLPLWGGYLGVTLWATRTKGTGVVRDLGFSTRASDAPVGLLVGVLAQLVVLPVLYVPILELTGRTTEDLSAPARELAGRAGELPGWVLFALIVGVGAPIVEELFYRGLFLRSLQKSGAPGVIALVVSAAVFAGVHFQALQFPGLFVFGLIAGALALRTGRLGPAVWAHVGFNATAVVALYQELHRT